MNNIIPGRRTAGIDRDELTVFLIGARLNRPWKVHRWVPVARAMRHMQAELADHPELGCLHVENWFGHTTISVQYWRDAAALDHYARSTDHEHLPAWRAFNAAIRDNGDVGIWHETYRVAGGDAEAIYGNMPLFGLAAAVGAADPADGRQTLRARLAMPDPDGPPVAPY